MNPEEKATQIVRKMANDIGTYHSRLVMSIARHCSINAVDLIIASEPHDKAYWLDVRRYILKNPSIGIHE